jgi:NAD(P)-dependent dehydrogenase (short-subunit alcohol dehydrogenase family)
MQIPDVKTLLDFTNKTVLVTGAGSGIGAGIARRFAQAGAAVAVHYRTSQAQAQAIAHAINTTGGHALAVQADVALADEVTRLFDDVSRAFGRVDVLINNAGAYPHHSLIEMTPQQWDDVLAANLRSAFLCTQAFAKHAIAENITGAIVNITSIEAENPAPGHAHYDASKAGLFMLTRNSAHELGPHNIRVNAIAPGLIGREGIEQTWPDGVQRWQRAAPLRRLGQPEDVADACLFLASPAARWITGASLTVDGGVMTRQIY